TIGALSGGNQQKALLARVLLSGARVLVLFDPARGVDVGTKQVIYGVIRDFAAGGGSVLVYSTELDELVQLVDRCLVMYRGRIVEEMAGEILTEDRLVALASGHGSSDHAEVEPRARSLSPRPLIFYVAKNGALIAATIFIVLLAVYAIREPGALTLS